jgi:hypothetical protein
MFAPVPIEKDFVPHTKRPIMPSNAALFINATGREPRGVSRVVPQQQVGECAGKPDGTPCGPLFNGRRLMSCVNGVCV